MLTGFSDATIQTRGAEIYCKSGGNGPPLVLLHGYPQTHVMWHKVAPTLAEHYTLILPDLRGYGASSTPPTTPDHAPYSKRAMAEDVIDVMLHFGYNSFGVLSHDRGARVAHRLGLDHPAAVKATMILDIAPTREMYARTDKAFATAYWHWFFLIQPAPFPETLIAADPDAYLAKKMTLGSAANAPFTDDAYAAYLDALKNPETIHAMCEDYRAAATIDIEHDDADQGRKLDHPLHVLWGKNGVIEACFDCLALWRERAERVSGHAIEGGHYLAEECPDEITTEALDFFGQHMT